MPATPSATTPRRFRHLAWLAALLPAGAAFAAPLTPEQAQRAEGLYQQYCALCHGDERAGYAADNAPSLRSPELMGSASDAFLVAAVAFGRPGTPMAAYHDGQGGPMDGDTIRLLVAWLKQASGAPAVSLPAEPIPGDAALGAQLYARDCASCHGADGEGISAPALGNPVLLATASDAFLRYAIEKGRGESPMPAFGDKLAANELDALTAFLRGRASGWSAPTVAAPKPPTAEEVVLNPDGPAPEFTLRDDRFVPADQVKAALDAGARMVLIDARATSEWMRGHIPGAVPVPYYSGPAEMAANLPRDGTWIVAYCACPHAASGQVVDALRAQGFSNTAIIDEGILVWAARAYPMASGNPADRTPASR